MRKLRRCVVVHFSPIEYYPPIQNLINVLQSASDFNIRLTVVTTLDPMCTLGVQEFKNANIQVLRIAKSSNNTRQLTRYFQYFLFYSSCLALLLWYRPIKVFYFETISSWPVFIYKKYFARDCEVGVHYHEYSSKNDYESGMMLGRYFHALEIKLYPKMTWLSHTNSMRMKLFLDDIRPNDKFLQRTFILPNYPPENWKRSARESIKVPVRIVYVGSLSLSTMYTREFGEWVVGQNGKVLWDIYAHNIQDDAKEFFAKLNSSWICLHDGVPYSALPSILGLYDVGIVLYNGHIPNYVHNAPNKVFEYIVSGLDVWFPVVMDGTRPYERNNEIPKVMAIDFKNLESFSLEKAIARTNKEYEVDFVAEKALRPLIDWFLLA